MDLDFWRGAGLALCFVIVLYVAARLVSHAYFKSRDDYERKKSHERKTIQGR